MALTREEVQHIARLCRLSMTTEELDEMSQQLSHILEQFEVLRQLDTEGVEATSHVADLASVLREDVVSDSLPREDVLANAPREQSGQFRVGVVIDDMAIDE